MGAVTLTLDGTSVAITHSCELVEDTVFGDTFKQRLISLQDAQITFEAINDYTDNELDEDLDAIMGTAVALVFRPSSGTIGVTNPSWTVTGSISSMTKTFAMGQPAKVSGTFQITSGALVRAVA